MTWSEQEGSVVLTDAYTLVYVSRQYSRTFLSDTRHTSFYATTQGCYIFIRTLCYHSGLLYFIFFYGIGAGSLLSCAAAPP